MIKRIFCAVFCVLFFCGILCGCYDYSDIEIELIVAGMAFDITESENGEQLYLVTAEVVTLNSQSSGQGQGSHSALVQNADKTPLAAIRGIMACSSKKLFFGHCKLIVLSSQVAQKGIAPILDLVFRDREIRLSMDVIVARGCKAHELLSVSTVMSSIKSYEIVQTVKTVGKQYGTAPSVNVNELLNRIYNGSDSAKAPFFTVKKSTDGKDSYFLDGLAVFRHDELCGFVSSQNSSFCLLASGEFESGTMTCTLPASSFPFTFNITDSSTNIDLERTDGGAELTLKLDLTVSFTEIPDDLPFFSEKDTDLIVDQISKYISDNVFEVVKDTIDRYGTDIFRFLPKLLTVYPRYLSGFDSPKQFLRTLKLKVETNISAEDNGLSGGNFYSSE